MAHGLHAIGFFLSRQDTRGESECLTYDQGSLKGHCLGLETHEQCLEAGGVLDDEYSFFRFQTGPRNKAGQPKPHYVFSSRIEVRQSWRSADSVSFFLTNLQQDQFQTVHLNGSSRTMTVRVRVPPAQVTSALCSLQSPELSLQPLPKFWSSRHVSILTCSIWRIKTCIIFFSASSSWGKRFCNQIIYCVFVSEPLSQLHHDRLGC